MALDKRSNVCKDITMSNEEFDNLLEDLCDDGILYSYIDEDGTVKYCVEHEDEEMS